MPEPRNILIHGLSLTLRRLPAFLWTYAFNLAIATLFSLSLYTHLSAITDHSLAAQPLTNGFDLGVAHSLVVQHLFGGLDADNVSDSLTTLGKTTTAPLFYLLIYFLLVPGTLFCYQTETPARLSTLLHQGLLHFWRFVRITLLTLFAYALILRPLILLQERWVAHVDESIVGRAAFLHHLIGYILIFVVASLLRLYFDLVEVHIVRLGRQLLPNGKPNHRVLQALRPAWLTLRNHFTQAWLTFLLLTLLGAIAVTLTARTAMHMLAQPRVWPMFLLAQLGLFLLLFTRFWQRGIETSLALQFPEAPLLTAMDVPLHPIQPTPDPIPDPEPAPPSQDEPDPGVFHHDPVKPPDKNNN